MAALQMTLPRSARPAVCNVAAMPSQLRAGAPRLHRPALLQSRRTACRVVVSAKLAKSEPNGPPPAVSTVDIVSSGLGAMVCTSFFVSRGQDPWEALTVTACSIVVALVLNQMLFSDNN